MISTAAQTLAQKAIAAGICGEQVDGNDVIAMRAATDEAIAAARSGDGPRLIEAVTYRLGDHTTADDAARYRPPEEVQVHWKEEPIARLRTYVVLVHGDFGRHKNRLLVPPFWPKSADADLPGTGRFHVNCEVRGSCGQLGIQRGYLALELVQFIDCSRLDPQLGQSGVGFEEFSHRVLDGGKLPLKIVLALRPKHGSGKLLELLFAAGERVQLSVGGRNLLRGARECGAGLVLASLLLGQLGREGDLDLAVGVDAADQLPKLLQPLRSDLDSPPGVESQTIPATPQFLRLN
jgi:hypothetical protein